MKKRIYLALIVSMLGICGCTPQKDSETAANKAEATIENSANEAEDNSVSSENTDSTESEDAKSTEAGETDESSDENAPDAAEESADANDEAVSSESDDSSDKADDSSNSDANSDAADKSNESDKADASTSSDDAAASSSTDSEASASEDEVKIPNNPIADKIVISEDLSYDYTNEIKDATAKISESSSTLQDELLGIEALENHFDEYTDKTVTQIDMTQAAVWYYTVWDTEINSLWSRISNTLKGAQKDNLLKEQRNWIAMKEEVVLETLGSREEGGSIYPQLEYTLLKDMTKTRSYYLASVLAEATGEDFTLPKRDISGAYVDNQDTGDVYSSLIIKEGWESGYECTVSIFRLGNLYGSVEAKGDDLIFTSDDEKVTGIIRYGWGGASFEVTKAADSIVEEGEVYEFKTIF